jgi:hypothetical protein
MPRLPHSLKIRWLEVVRKQIFPEIFFLILNFIQKRFLWGIDRRQLFTPFSRSFQGVPPLYFLSFFVYFSDCKLDAAQKVDWKLDDHKDADERVQE